MAKVKNSKIPQLKLWFSLTETAAAVHGTTDYQTALK